MAGRGERLAAWLIDMALYAVVVIVALIIAMVAIFALGVGGDGFENIGDDFDEQFFVAFALIILLFVPALLALFIAQMALLAKRGQTIGKILLKIRVVDATTGEHPGWARLVPSPPGISANIRNRLGNKLC